MNLGDALLQMREFKQLASVDSELIDHLRTLLEDGSGVPIDGEDGNVDEDYVRQVLEEIEKHRSDLLSKLKDMEKLDVADPPGNADSAVESARTESGRKRGRPRNRPVPALVQDEDGRGASPARTGNSARVPVLEIVSGDSR